MEIGKKLKEKRMKANLTQDRKYPIVSLSDDQKMFIERCKKKFGVGIIFLSNIFTRLFTKIGGVYFLLFHFHELISVVLNRFPENCLIRFLIDGNNCRSRFMAYNRLIHFRKSFQEFFYSRLTVSTHHTFDY